MAVGKSREATYGVDSSGNTESEMANQTIDEEMGVHKLSAEKGDPTLGMKMGDYSPRVEIDDRAHGEERGNRKTSLEIADQNIGVEMGSRTTGAENEGQETSAGFETENLLAETDDKVLKANSEARTNKLNGVNMKAGPVLEKEAKEAEVDQTEGLPIDRGWAWVVLAGATFYLIMFGGIRKNFGIFFVAIQDRFGSTASLTSLLTTIQNLTLSFSSLVIMTVGMQFMSNRMCIITGSILLTTANIITAFATDIRLLFTSIGFLEGAGTALIHPTVTATLGEYFHKRRGLANGLAFSGASFGGLIFAPIMAALFEDFGYSGTLMVVAGMTLNFLITGALLRPIKSFEKVRRPHVQVGRNEVAENDKTSKGSDKDPKKMKDNDVVLVSPNSLGNGVHDKKNDTDDILRQLLKEKENRTLGAIQNRAVLQLKTGSSSTVKIVRSDSYEKGSDANTLCVSPLLPRSRAWSFGNQRTRTISQNSQRELSPLNNVVESLSRSRVALYSGADSVCGSVIDIQEISQKQNSKDTPTSRKVTFRSKLKSSFDVSLFKNWLFPTFLCMAAMFAPASFLFPTFLAPLAKDLGLSAKQTGILMSIVGGVGMSSRIMCALIADRKFVKLTTILALAATLAGIVGHCARFFTTFHSLVFVAVVFGLCCEIYQSMFPVLLVEYLTLPKLKSCIGFTLLCHGLAVACTFPVVGYLRDVTGSYYAPYHFLGTMSFVGAILAMILPHIHKQRQMTEMEV